MVKTVKGKVIDKIILREGVAGQNIDGGHYDEVLYILEDEEGKHYKFFWSSADFDYCPLYGVYENCYNCQWHGLRWLPCKCGEECPRDSDCYDCLEKINFCEDPDGAFIKTEDGRIYWARRIK